MGGEASHTAVRAPGRTRVWWLVLLGLGLAACVAVALLPVSEPPEVSLYFGVAGAACLAIVVAAARAPRATRTVWWALAVAVVLLTAGDAVYDVQQDVFDEPPFPGWAEPLYFGAYAALLVALVVLVRRRSPGRDREAWLDAAIMSLAAIALIGAFLVVPMVANSDQEPLATLTAVTYPVLDVLLLSALIRLMVAGGRWHGALGLVAVAMLMMLAADLSYNALVMASSDETSPSWIEAMFLSVMVLLAAAAWSRDAGTVTAPVPDRAALTRARMTGLTLGALSAPVALAAQTWWDLDASARLLAGTSVGVIVLVLWRVLLLFRTVSRQSGQLAELARRDALTGLPNRRTWDFELQRAEQVSRASGRSTCLAMLDLDHFKAYNDLHGHPGGDAVLRACAAAWQAALGNDGFLARYGGEEFAMLLPGCTVLQAETILERVRAATPTATTVSVGVALWDGVESLADAVDRADRALYAAKSLGRDRVVVHDGGRSVPADRTGRVTPLRRQVVGVFQPVVDLETRAVRAYDAHARLPRLRPRESREAAARAGFGPAFEATALALALEGARDGVPVRVSLSASGLLESDVLGSLPADLGSVRMVVTPEDLAGDLAADMLATMPMLRVRGAEVTYLHGAETPLDLSAVERLSPDLIVVDAGLVRPPSRDDAVVRALVAHARSHGVPLVADDVQTDDDADALLDLGVTTGTGRLFDGVAHAPRAEPVPPTAPHEAPAPPEPPHLVGETRRLTGTR